MTQSRNEDSDDRRLDVMRLIKDEEIEALASRWRRSTGSRVSRWPNFEPNSDWTMGLPLGVK
jgi:hypothetical protein